MLANHEACLGPASEGRPESFYYKPTSQKTSVIIRILFLYLQISNLATNRFRILTTLDALSQDFYRNGIYLCSLRLYCMARYFCNV